MSCITSSTRRGKDFSNRASAEITTFGFNTSGEFASGSTMICAKKNGVAAHRLKICILHFTFTVATIFRFGSNSFLP